MTCLRVSLLVSHRAGIHPTPNSLLLPDGEGNGTPLQYSCLENPMDGEAWQAAVLEVAKSRTLSNFTLTFQFHALEKEMATHSSVLAWRIPGMGEPGGLPSMGLHRVGHDQSDLAAATAEWLRSQAGQVYAFASLHISCGTLSKLLNLSFSVLFIKIEIVIETQLAALK